MTDYAKLIEEAETNLQLMRPQDGVGQGSVRAILAALKDTTARAERAETELESLATPAGWSNIQSRPAALFVQDRIDKAEANLAKWKELARGGQMFVRDFHLEWSNHPLLDAAKQWLAKLRELEAE